MVAACTHLYSADWEARTWCSIILFRATAWSSFCVIVDVGIAGVYGSTGCQLLF